MSITAAHLVEIKTIGDAMRHGATLLKSEGIESPALDARVLLAGSLDIEMSRLVASMADGISVEAKQAFLQMIDQRLLGKPVHRILGFREFFGRKFLFGNDCLEPRPETELLVERVLADHRKNTESLFGEIGVGSGVICCSLLAEMVNSRAIGTDIAAGALDATGENAKTLGVDSRLDLHQTSCFEGLEAKFDFIVSNPPYIEAESIADLAKEVRLFDPVAALDGGADGLDMYRKILQHCKPFLRPGGKLYLETGHGQHQTLASLADEKGWGIVSMHLDLSGLERIVVLNA